MCGHAGRSSVFALLPVATLRYNRENIQPVSDSPTRYYCPDRQSRDETMRPDAAKWMVFLKSSSNGHEHGRDFFQSSGAKTFTVNPPTVITTGGLKETRAGAALKRSSCSSRESRTHGGAGPCAFRNSRKFALSVTHEKAA
jgi:hypothetical protein